jgi:hypothetical protein
MTATVQAESVGERLVALWLAERGYSTNATARTNGSADIEVRGPRNSMLVQVRSALAPDAPTPISPDEERRIQARAQQMGLEAWEARVQLNSQLQQVGEIQWRRLA